MASQESERGEKLLEASDAGDHRRQDEADKGPLAAPESVWP